MGRDKLEKIAVIASAEYRRRTRIGGFAPDSPMRDLWGHVNTDIATFLAGIDSLASDDSDANYEALLEATDRLLWASARTRLELERLLGNRKKRGFSPSHFGLTAGRDSSRGGLSPVRGPSAARDGRRGLSLRRRADHKETGLEDYCLDERPDPERHPKANERLTAPASHAISHAGSELSGPKVDGRR